jgi:myo-inositol 2-dehydrogenase/D-chiro-inositol 1-dehydrogenase
MGGVHLRGLRALTPNVRLTAVAEPRADLVTASDLIGDAVVYPGAAQALRHPGLDGCIVVTPTETHAAIVADALELGLHVFCEKPLTLRRDESLQLHALAESRGLALQVGFWRRFSPPLVEARRLLQEGAIGRPILLRLVQWDVECPPAAWCDPRRSGGIFVDMGVHEYDEIEWLLDTRITEVTVHPLARVNKELADVGDFDNVIVFAGLECGAHAIVDLSRNGRYADDVRLEILGSDGALFADTIPTPRVRVGTRGRLETVWEDAGGDAFLDAVAAELAAFGALATGGAAAAAVAGAAESIRATLIGEAASDSASSGALVRI